MQKATARTVNSSYTQGKKKHHQWMDAESPNCTADEYFKDISYMVPLKGTLIWFNPSTDLHLIEDTCYYDDSLPYIPVLIKIQ